MEMIEDEWVECDKTKFIIPKMQKILFVKPKGSRTAIREMMLENEYSM